MKKVLAFVSALCMLIALIPAAVAADTYEGLTYSVSGGKVTITDCDPSVTGEFTIPETIAGYPVTTIAYSAFADCTGLTAITIGKNVTNIDTAVFSGCTNLAAITVAAGNPVYHSAGNCLIETSSKTLVAGCKDSVIPTDGTVTAISNMAFYNCKGLTAITVPDSITTIGASAFEGCAQLGAATLGNQVTSIGNSAFFGCTALTEIVIPDSVKTLGVFVFSGCTALTSAVVGAQVATIGNSAFQGCTALTDITLGAGLTAIDVFAFSGCTKLEEVALPDSVVTVGKFAFYNCGALKRVEIPASVSAIGSNAFAGCSQLTLAVSVINTYAVTYAKNNSIPYTMLEKLAVTTVTLKPGVAGVYFRGDLSWAEDAQMITAYGIAVSTENPLPVADDSDASSRYTLGCTSVLVKDIMRTDKTNAENGNSAQKKIYARSYVRLESGEYIYSEAVEVTLRQVVMGAQNKWDSLTAVQQDALKQMYQDYQNVMASWNIPNLKAA